MWSTGHVDDRSRDVACTISRPLAEVVAFAGDPANLPRWAAGLSTGIRNDDGRWITDSPMGAVEVRFVGDVGSGVLDHDAVFPDGTVDRNRLRVRASGSGCEVVFTVAQHPGMSAADVDRDAAAVAADLERLRTVLEQG